MSGALRKKKKKKDCWDETIIHVFIFNPEQVLQSPSPLAKLSKIDQ